MKKIIFPQPNGENAVELTMSDTLYEAIDMFPGDLKARVIKNQSNGRTIEGYFVDDITN